MNIKAVRTHKITRRDTDLTVVLDKYINNLEEKSVIAISSKIVAICEGRVIDPQISDKDELVRREAEMFLPPQENSYNVSFAVKNNLLSASAGIDESNADGQYVLWPENPQVSANNIREYLVKRFGLSEVGVVVTDSKTSPLRWGVTGVALSHSGFSALKNYIGEKDLFGREFQYEKLSIMDSLAASAVVVMGEGSEQTPLAVITDIPFVDFQDRSPTEEELSDLNISIEQDLYSPFLRSVKWEKGGEE